MEQRQGCREAEAPPEAPRLHWRIADDECRGGGAGAAVRWGWCSRRLAAHAQEQKVKIQVEVVLASNKGNAVEPPELAQMKETFQQAELQLHLLQAPVAGDASSWARTSPPR